MNNKQNIFYTSISEYYSEIFPYNPMQLQFVKNCIGDLDEKQILDIGCATGELAFSLANESAIVTGIDLNEDLLKQAIGNSGFSRSDSFGETAKSNNADWNPHHPGVADSIPPLKKHNLETTPSNQFTSPKFKKGNMLELKSNFTGNQFDTILCFGNTLVHLPTTQLIKQMLEGVNSVLKPGGLFLLQILNYDYILGEKVSKLPLIETENIKFIRNYKFEKDSSLIQFQTNLHLKKKNKIVSNETSLLAIKSKQLIELLESTGFSNIELFCNFKQNTFGGDHLPLVLKCKK